MKIVRFLTLLCAVATLAIGCEDSNEGENTKPAGNIILSADKESLLAGETITFTVTTEDGTDITSEATFIDKSHDFATISNPYVVPLDGEYEVYAVANESNSNTVKFSATITRPTLPEDANPAKLDFHHRILLVDHTGSKCSFCPKMMMKLQELAELEGYHEKYYEAMSHSYSQNITADLAYSPAAGVISAFFGVREHPKLTYNFDNTKQSSYNDDIKGNVDKYWSEEGADAGIAAITAVGRKVVYVNAAVKVKSAGDYRLAVWLLEDGIYELQVGGTAEWQSTHNNVVRSILSNDPLSGMDLGTLEAGATITKELSFEDIHRKWVPENFKVMLIVSKRNENGRYDVANVTVCPGNGFVDFEYHE